MAQAINHRHRDVAGQHRLQHDRLVLVGLTEQHFQTGHVTLLQQPNDAQPAIGQILHQLHQSLADSKNMARMIGGAIERLTDPEAQLIDRFVDQLEVVVPKIGEEHQIADAALSALRRPGPGDFDVTNVQSRPRVCVVYVRRVQRDPARIIPRPTTPRSGPAGLANT